MKQFLSLSLILLLLSFSSFENLKQKDSKPEINLPSDEEQVQNLIQESFDSLFSAFNEDLILNYYTEDFLLLEQGDVWDNEFLRNYFIRVKSNSPKPVRMNRFEFISTKIDGDRAWVAYQNYATISSPGQKPRNLHWLESATAVRTPKGWRLDMLHSTRVEK